MINRRRKLPRSAGLSLIELLIALGIGAFLMLGVVSVFIATKSSSTAEASLANIQNNGRLAIDLISQDIRKAHYSGCNSVGGIVDLIATGVTFEGVRGFSRAASDGAWSPDVPVALAIGATNGRRGSDMVNIQMATSLGKNILAADINANDDEATLTSNPGCEIKQNDLIIVSSCLSAHLVKVTNAIVCNSEEDDITLEFKSPGNIASSVEPGYRYGDPSELMRYESVSWYVADTGRDQFEQDVYALYRSSNGVAEEMVEGVEYIKFEFGQKVGNQMRYVPASDVNIDWNEVSTMRVAFLIQGFDSLRNDIDSEPYELLNTVVSASGDGAHSGGRVLRKVFTTTATLRNTDYEI
ncbi:PilW family protein [Candidatus Marimicrobium litorale]|uniref:Type IV pilus assembly protein PilW n=1 Tax=Candidatus Marimicrobium litorale TaxID=2518991 RepID=A0ABT3TAS6_9GAMM|nr:PilW family protein [Candidatus Marimicrobium litorale]MCX2979144.1 hypothetical protein [Candidatus Marimicrobium litorale]